VPLSINLCKDHSWSDIPSGMRQGVCDEDWFGGANDHDLCDGGLEVGLVFPWYRTLSQMHWWWEPSKPSTKDDLRTRSCHLGSEARPVIEDPCAVFCTRTHVDALPTTVIRSPCQLSSLCKRFYPPFILQLAAQQLQR